MTREKILQALRAQINVNNHIVGAAVGSGMTAKFAAMGGADFLLALTAGKYRIMGRSSFASFLSYDNNNASVMEMGRRELFPIIRDTPILFGLMASDPMISLYDFLKKIRDNGFSGVVNFPTLALIDGRFREALEEEGVRFAQEVEAIEVAHFLDLFTVAFVTNEAEAEAMTRAGADVVCAHFGLTKGGFLSPKRSLSLAEARKLTDGIYGRCSALRPDVIKMIYAGPANTPIDMQYLYNNTDCQGFIGGSTFDRIPTERAIYNTVRAFKSYGSFDQNDPAFRLIHDGWNFNDGVSFVKRYIEQHYSDRITLGDLALVFHISPSYLSARFKKETGMSFTEYLIHYRMNKAKEFLKAGHISCTEAAQSVGYHDYAQFSKTFKKYVGVSPMEYRRQP